jgi:uncharacterized protein (TIGR00730 family)
MTMEEAKKRYVITPEDKAFFYSDAARGIRLQVDYLKAETKMKAEGIEHTIVVFGSARILSQEEAQKRLDTIDANDTEAYTKALKDLERSRYYEEARTFGALVAHSGKGPEDCKLTLMTGGGPGIMEGANRGAYEAGGKSIGLNITLPHEQHPNPYLSPELSFSFYYFGIRKLHFLQRAKALVVFPGGFGTLDELFDILTLIQTNKSPHIPIVLIGRTYWNSILNFTFLAEEGVISRDDLNLFSYAESAEEAWQYIIAWYAERGDPLFS